MLMKLGTKSAYFGKKPDFTYLQSETKKET